MVEIGPVGPATQKEVAPAQANTSRKRDAAEASAEHSQQQPVALLSSWPRYNCCPRPQRPATNQLRQPHNRAAAAGSKREARAGCQHQYDDTEQACATVGYQSGVARLGAAVAAVGRSGQPY